MNYRDLNRKLHDEPFRPFRIKLVNGTAYDVVEPWMVMVGETSAIVATNKRKDDTGYEVVTDWRTISIDHIIEFSDIEGPKKPLSRRSSR